MAPTIFAHKSVTWKFNPPGAPHHGGSWERLVRSVKRVLYDILSSRRVTEEVLGTTLCLVELALSSRPITPVRTDSRELEALTPNHFLLGQHATSFPSLLPAYSDFTLKTGDLVWVIELDSPRGYYPLARIVKLNYGQDSFSRRNNETSRIGKFIGL